VARENALQEGTAREDASTKSAEAGAPNRNHGLRGAFICHMNNMGSPTLWFLGIATLIAVLLSTGFRSPLEACLVLIVGTSPVFLLVMGIVMPTYLESMLSFGVTRKQHATALLLSGAALTGGLALIAGILILPISGADPINYPIAFTFAWFSFLIGWLISIGYQYRHVLTAFFSTLIGVALFLLGPSWPHFLLMRVPVDPLTARVSLGLLDISPANANILSFASMALVIVILMPTVLALTRRIPIKV
jgi:hypothetical protein